MNPHILACIEEAYPTKRLDALNGAVVEKYCNVKEASAIVNDIRQVPGIECEMWHPDDEQEKSLRILVVTPSLSYWNREFHSQQRDKRIKVLRDHGGTYCNMTIEISNVSPFYVHSWTCFRLLHDSQINVSSTTIAPTSFWEEIGNVIDTIFNEHGRTLLTQAEARKGIPWIDSDSDLEERGMPVTVFRCLFEEM